MLLFGSFRHNWTPPIAAISFSSKDADSHIPPSMKRIGSFSRWIRKISDLQSKHFFFHPLAVSSLVFFVFLSAAIKTQAPPYLSQSSPQRTITASTWDRKKNTYCTWIMAGDGERLISLSKKCHWPWRQVTGETTPSHSIHLYTSEKCLLLSHSFIYG